MNVLRERFIEKAIKKHGDLYDYSNIDYVNGRTKIILNCKEHGDFTDSYERAIYVWSENDLEKRKIALENKLNYVVFWDADLTDAKHWFQIGCPDNFDMSII